MEEFLIKFVTAVVTGKYDDLVVFGPSMVVNGQKYTLQAWVPKDKGARKGSEILGTPVISVKQGAQVVKSYVDNDGQEIPLANWKLEVVLSGDYSFQKKETKTVSLEEFFRNS